MRRFAALSALLLSVVLLAPRLALAHGSAHQESVKQAHPDRARLLPSCPGQHGDSCTCGDPVVCSSGVTIAIAAPALTLRALVPPVRGDARAESLARGAPPAFSLRFSRAPPAFS